MARTPTRGTQGFNFAIPVNTITLVDENKERSSKIRNKLLNKIGMSFGSTPKQRSSSYGSNYASDFSAHTSGLTLSNQKEITEEEFQTILSE